MRRVLLIVLLAGIMLCPLPALAVPPDYAGGINNEYQYEEIVFLSGEPIKFMGSCDVSEKGNGDLKSISYKFSLEPEDKGIEGKLDRRVTYETVYSKYAEQGQTTGQTTVKSCRETVEIGDDKFVLEDYQFSGSDVIDNRPASDFNSGTLVARKYYLINKDEGTALLDISGGTSGYSNFWGRTETQILDYTLRVDRTVVLSNEEGDEEDTRKVSWEGSARVLVSDSTRKSLLYSANNATLSTIPGGHMVVTDREMFSRYDYNLPRMNDGAPSGSSRDKGQIELNTEMLPQVARLIIPKFRDIGGHWAEEDIRRLYSLNVFEGDSPFFLPDTPMSRADFIMAMVKSCNIQVQAEQNSRSRFGSRTKTQETSPFRDVPVTDPRYTSIKAAVERGLIKGSTTGYFMPEQSLTRAQAVTILIRALGFEHNAPAPGYSTQYSDDASIPDWARDSIYVASNIGLIEGNGNRIYPERVMTRAEASAMLVRFLNFLERDLQEDYREDIVLYQ